MSADERGFDLSGPLDVHVDAPLDTNLPIRNGIASGNTLGQLVSRRISCPFRGFPYLFQTALNG